MSARLDRLLSLDDFEAAARRRLPRPIFGYIAGAAERDVSLRDNTAAFQDVRFLPRMLVDVSDRSTEVTLFGERWAAPFGVAPMGAAALAGYRADLAMAAAAADHGVPMIVSAASLIAIEEIAAQNPRVWFQAYLPATMPEIMALIDRVERAGIATLVITVDSAVAPNRENNLRNGYSTPLKPSLKLLWQGVTHPVWAASTFLRTLALHGMPHFENAAAERGPPALTTRAVEVFPGRMFFDWDGFARIRRRWTGRLVLKGLLHPGDAARARDAGADGVILSNHGGRQLDGAVSPLRVLPEVAARAGAMSVTIDSGFRRGTDVLKAIGLGADFVFVGRPFNYGAAIAGRAGVSRAMDLLKGEILTDMAMLGLNRVGQMSRDHLCLDAFVRPDAGAQPRVAV